MTSQEMCYFIEFKLVPNCNIHGAYGPTDVAGFDNPFVKKLASAQKSNIIMPNNDIIV